MATINPQDVCILPVTATPGKNQKIMWTSVIYEKPIA